MRAGLRMKLAEVLWPQSREVLLELLSVHLLCALDGSGTGEDRLVGFGVAAITHLLLMNVLPPRAVVDVAPDVA